MSRYVEYDSLVADSYESDMWDRGTQRFNLRIVEVDDIEKDPPPHLVRCAECKYHYGEYCFRLVSKEAWIVLGSQCVITMQPNDFCSYGERKE